MAKNTTTLYIDDTNIRLMVTRGKRITKLANVPLDTGLTEINTEEKEAELVEKIKQLFKTNRIGARKIIVGLSGLHCLTRPLVLPELPRAMLDEAVNREARRVLPVPVEQLYVSWQVVRASEGKLQAFMVATPRQIADTLLRVLNKAGFKPYLMDIKPLALSRLARETTCIVVDVQTREFDVVVLADGIPQPIRTVTFPQESLSSRDRLAIVKDEIKRTVQFYNSNNPDSPIQPNVTMYVSGELADEPVIYEPLAQELGYQVAPLSSSLKCMKHLDPSHHLVNVGLALKELTREAGALLPNFNTLPLPYQPRQISTNKLIAIPVTAAAIGLIVLLAMTVQDAAANIQSVQNQLEGTNFILEKKQSQMKELTEKITAAEKKLAGMESGRDLYTKALASVNNEGDRMNGDLEAAVETTVPDLDLANIGLDGGGLRLQGSAGSEQKVLEYARNLDATGRFTEITISNMSRSGASDNESGAMSFSLIIKLKGIK
ncbi:MAG: pilus assembly protein PilM [Chloroflexota bacterium]